MRQAAHVHRTILMATPVEESLNPKDVFRHALVHRSTDPHFREMLKEQPRVKADQWPTTVVNVMGVAKGKHRTDGAIPAIQAEMLRPLFNHQPVKYYEHTFDHISHSGLHQQDRVLKYVMAQLWKP